jgi:hypothetical protein
VPQIARRARRRERSGRSGLHDGGVSRVTRARVHRAHRRGGPRVRIPAPPAASLVRTRSPPGILALTPASCEKAKAAGRATGATSTCLVGLRRSLVRFKAGLWVARARI